MTKGSSTKGKFRHDLPGFELINFAINKVHEAAFLVDENAYIHYVNDNACHVLGYTRDELLDLTVADIDPDFPGEKWTGHWNELKSNGSLLFEGRHVTKDGRIFPVEINANYFEFEGQSYNLALIRDITERRGTEELQKRMNRELKAISNCNQTLLRALDENTLLSEICRIICDEAGYRLAWVGYAENDEAKTIRPVAWAGFDSGYIENARLSWSEDSEHGQGPAGQVIRTGELIFVQDFSSDPRMTPWIENIRKRGYRSGIALPLKDERSKVFGVLLIYSTEKEAITPDEIRLLDELSEDLAFGIINIRMRAERKQAEEKVVKLNRIYAALSNLNQTIVRVHDSGEILDEACRIAVEYGKFKMSWIGLINFQTNKVEVVASNGFTGDYLDKINIDLNDPLRSSDPTGLAIKTGKHAISNDVPNDEKMIPWQADAHKYGYRSVASFPLVVFNKIIGAFTIYDSELNFFHEEDITLLNEMAGDISFAFEFIETEANRKNAEESLRKSEERYRIITENTVDTISVLDLELHFMYISPSVLKLRGYSAEESITQVLDQIFTPASLEKVYNLFGEQMALEATGTADPFRTESLELEEYCKDGSTIWVEIMLSFIRDENLRPTEILTVTRDITERKQAEEDRRDHLRFFKSMDRVNRAIQGTHEIENMMTAVLNSVLEIFECDRAWFVNPCDPDANSFRVPMEVTRPEYPGANIRNINIPMYPDLADNLRDALESDEPITFVTGTERPINKVTAEHFAVKSQMFIALYPKFGKPWAFGLHQCSFPRIWTPQEQILFKEIARRLEDSLTSLLATQHLQESEQRLREAQRIAHISSWELDIVNNVLTWSDEIYRIFEIDPMNFGGSYEAFLDTIHPDDREAVNLAYSNSLKARVPYAIDHRLRFEDGRIKYVHEQCETFYDAHDNPLRSLGTVQDISERKKTEMEITKLNQELEQRVAQRTAQLETANKELESFSYSVAHDLRTPLRGIDGFSQVLLEDFYDQIDAEGKSYLMRIHSSVQRMAQLIDDLLNLSHINRGEMKIQQVNLSKMARDIAGDLHLAQPERQVEFIIHEEIKVRGDARLLRIVLENLIGNAWKFTSNHPKACIEFGIRQQNEGTVYFIRDDGAGFDMKYVHKLFGAFQRLHTEREFSGTGVGLATVQRVIHRHGGNVWAEGEVGKGSTFYFTL